MLCLGWVDGGARMTESEKLIKSYADAIDCLKKNKPTSGSYMLQESVDMAINALEEIQKYRAIGTVEECQTAMKRQNPIATIAEKEDTGTIASVIDAQPTAYDPDKVVEQLEERTAFLKDCTKYGNKTAEQQSKSYDTMMMYEVKDLVDDLLEIVKAGGTDAKTDS